jgi:hypothetical protein
LVIVTELPEIGRVAVMHARGHFDPERMAYETWPGDIQVTCYGCVKDTDCCVMDAMIREASEELGPSIGQKVAADRQRVVLLDRYESHGRDVTLFGLCWPDPSWMRQVVLHPASGGLRITNQSIRIPYARYFAGHERAAMKALQVVK